MVGFYFFSVLDKGGENLSPFTPGIGTANVPPEVMKWEPLVRKYAQEFGVEPYVPLMLALIMQESNGRSLDVMQSAGATRFS
ncbi:lysozyme family protein, partial [Bacillus toyonensis]